MKALGQEFPNAMLTVVSNESDDCAFAQSQSVQLTQYFTKHGVRVGSSSVVVLANSQAKFVR